MNQDQSPEVGSVVENAYEPEAVRSTRLSCECGKCADQEIGVEFKVNGNIVTFILDKLSAQNLAEQILMDVAELEGKQ